MFKSLKSLLDQRLGSLIVQDDISLPQGYFIKVDQSHLNAATYFLKHDPDTRLTLLDQIIVIPTKILEWPNKEINSDATHEIIYQLRSLKLPYRVNIVIEVSKGDKLLPSISSLFAGALWLENDIAAKFNFDIAEH